jgi:hypothetical protein
VSLTTDVLELLDALGHTEDQVAESLRKLGVTGLRGEPCACPVFYYLKQAGIPVESVRTFIHLTTGETVKMPSAVGVFVADFDAYPEAWPELVEPEAVNR